MMRIGRANESDRAVNPWRTPMDLREIAIANQHRCLRLRQSDIVRAIRHLDGHFGQPMPNGKSRYRVCPPGELSLVFLDDAALAQLHGDFLDDPSSTDVITFEGDAAFGNAGEICVSADTAAAYAKKHGRSFSTELTLYVVHGWLHLAGYDDLQPAKKRVMRRAEARAMTLLEQAGLVPRFVLRTVAAKQSGRAMPRSQR